MSIPSRTTDVLLNLEPTPAAAAAARHELRRRGLPEHLEHTVTLLVSETVGNAVRHSGAARGAKIVVYARLDDDRARVEVVDPGPGFDPEVRHGAEGFGLRLIDKLASQWGVEATRSGCRVWFEVDRGRRRFSAAGSGSAATVAA